MADIGKLVAEIVIQTEGAIDSIEKVSSQLKTAEDGIRQVNKIEKEYGETQDTVKAKIEMRAKKVEALQKLNKEMADGIEEINKKERETGELSQTDMNKRDNLYRNQNKYNQELDMTKLEMKAITEEYDRQNAKIDEKTGKERQSHDEKKQMLEEEKRIQKEMDEERAKALQKQREEGKKEMREGVDKTISAGTKLAAPAIAAVTAGAKTYVDFEEAMIGATRIAIGTDEQNQELKEIATEHFYKRPEGVDEYFSALEEAIKMVDPSQYKDMGEIMENMMNYSLALDMNTDDLVRINKAFIESYGTSVEDFKQQADVINVMQNEYGVDAERTFTIAGLVAPMANQSGFTHEAASALAGQTEKSLPGMGEQAIATAISRTMNLIGSTGFENTDTAESYVKRYGSVKAIKDELARGNESLRDSLKANAIKPSDFTKELDNLAFKEDIKKYTGFSQGDIREKLEKGDGMDIMVPFLEGLSKESKDSGRSVADILDSKDYLSENIREQQVIAALVSNPEGLSNLYNSAKSATGSEIDLEAEEMKETAKYRFQVAWKELQKELMELGEVAIPVILRAIEVMKPTVKGLLDLLTGFMDIVPDGAQATVIAGLIGAIGTVKMGGALLDFKEGIGMMMGGYKKWTDASTAVGTASTIASGKMSGVTTTMSGIGGSATGLASSLGVFALKLAAVAGVVYTVTKAMEYLHDKGVDERKYERSRGVLSKEEIKEIDDITDSRRQGNYVIDKVSRGGEGVLTDDNIKGLKESNEKMINSVEEKRKEITDRIAEIETGNEKADEVIRSKYEKELTILDKELEDFTSKQNEIGEIYAQIIENNGNVTDEQSKKLRDLNEEVTKLYTDILSGSDEEKFARYHQMNEGNKIIHASKDEKKEIYQEAEDDVREKSALFKTEKEILSDAFRIEGTMTREEYEKAIEDLESTARADIIANVSESITAREDEFGLTRWFNYKGNAEKEMLDSGMFTKEEVGSVKSGQRVYEALGNIHPEDTPKGTEELLSLLKGRVSESRDGEGLLELGSGGLSDIMREMSELESYSFGNISDLVSHLDQISPDLMGELRYQMQEFNLEVENGAITNMDDLELYVATNMPEIHREMIESSELWENTEFMDKLMEIDFEDENARYKMVELVEEYGEIPDRVATTVELEKELAEMSLEEYKEFIENEDFSLYSEAEMNTVEAEADARGYLEILGENETSMYTEARFEKSIAEMDVQDFESFVENTNPKVYTKAELDTINAEMTKRGYEGSLEKVPTGIQTLAKLLGTPTAIGLAGSLRGSIMNVPLSRRTTFSANVTEGLKTWLQRSRTGLKVNIIRGAIDTGLSLVGKSRKKYTGSSYFEGGLAVLGDGNKEEPYLTPDGDFGISPSVDTLFDLPKGTKIWESKDAFEQDIPYYKEGTERSFLDDLGGLGESKTEIIVNAVEGMSEEQVARQVKRELKKAEREKNRLRRSGGLG